MLFFLICIIGTPIFGNELPQWKILLNSLTDRLTVVNSSLKTMSESYENVSSELEMLRSEHRSLQSFSLEQEALLEEQRIELQGSMMQLEREKLLLQSQKEQLERWKGLYSDLSKNFSDYKQSAEREIRTARTLFIITGVVLASKLTIDIIRWIRGSITER